MDEEVQDYVAALAAEHRPRFDRIHGLILETFPDGTVSISYRIPTYKTNGNRLFVGVWRHGVSIYG